MARRFNINKKLNELAIKYYGTDNLGSLQPYQLDKLVTWSTKMKPDAGKSSQRKAGNALNHNRKYKPKGKPSNRRGLVGT